MKSLLKILNSLRSGFVRSAKAWKGILIIWLITLFIVSLVALPMKSALSTGMGNSTISEQLKNGINVEVFADLRANVRTLGSYFSKGLMMILLVGFVVNSFLAGGIFSCVGKDSGKFSSQKFFKASAEKFWSYLIITLIFSLLILFLSVLIIIIPVSLLTVSETATEVIVFNSAILLGSLFLFVVIIILIAADYARAWQGANSQNVCFRAIAFGIRNAFRFFFTSYPLMLTVLIIQVFYLWLVLKIIHGINPGSGIGIIILFISSQILFIIKLFLKISRYASITALMESENRSEDSKNVNS